MALHAISVKELRQKFPFVQSELSKGESFLLICKSKPIATITPVNENGANGDIIIDPEKDIMRDFERAGMEEWAKLPPLTKEEHDYYMSLAPKDMLKNIF